MNHLELAQLHNAILTQYGVQYSGVVRECVDILEEHYNGTLSLSDDKITKMLEIISSANHKYSKTISDSLEQRKAAYYDGPLSDTPLPTSQEYDNASEILMDLNYTGRAHTSTVGGYVALMIEYRQGEIELSQEEYLEFFATISERARWYDEFIM